MTYLRGMIRHSVYTVRKFYEFTGRFLPLVQIHYKNNTIYSKITQLQIAYEIRNQFDIGLNATYAKLSGEEERGTEVERSDS